MSKYETKNQFYKTEAKVLLADNDGNAPDLVGWLIEKHSNQKDKIMEVKKDIEALVYGYNGEELSNEDLKEEMKKIADRIFEMVYSKK